MVTSEEFEYSYEDGELIIDGDACQCEIDGDIMTITVEISSYRHSYN